MSFSGTKGYITKPKPGVMLNSLHPLSRGLVGYWLFNEGSGSLANDISGYGNHGTLNNMSPNAQGSGWGGSKFGGGLEFDGVDDYVDCGSGGSLELQNFTLEWWAYHPSDERVGYIYGGDYNVNNRGIGVYVNSTSAPARMWFGDGTSITIENLVFPAITINKWQHFVVIKNGVNLKTYLDNKLIKEFTYNNTIDYTGTGGIRYVGNGLIGSAYTFNGSIRSVNIYNRALSAEEIAWSYREPYAMFEPAFNSVVLYSAVPPVGAIMNQFQTVNLGAGLYQGAVIA